MVSEFRSRLSSWNKLRYYPKLYTHISHEYTIETNNSISNNER